METENVFPRHVQHTYLGLINAGLFWPFLPAIGGGKGDGLFAPTTFPAANQSCTCELLVHVYKGVKAGHLQRVEAPKWAF
jgi:hypothetical protein